MNRKEILENLKSYKVINGQRYQLEEIGIFGSVANGTFSDNSDIDVVLKISKPDLFVLGHIKDDLELLLGKKIDTIRLRDNMNTFLKSRIEREAIYV